MTNTKFRKRALLSSVAMLLVAMIALGSATFAWFSANPTVTASKLKLSATAGAGIQIASDYVIGSETDTDAIAALYDYTTDLSDDSTTEFSLQPASPKANDSNISNNTLSFGWVGGTAPNNKAAKGTFDDTTPYTIGGTASRVFYEDIWLKSTSGDSVLVSAASVNISSVTHANKQIERGIKVALVDGDNLIGIWKADDGDNTNVWKGTKTANTPASDLEAFTAGYKGNNTPVNTLSISVDGKVKGETGAKKIRMYVYLDGENDHVISDNALSLTHLVSGITVTFSTEAL